MAEKLDPQELVTFNELTLSNVWQLEALVAVLERKDLLTKEELLDMLQELRQMNPSAAAPRQTLQLPTEKADILIQHILTLFNATGLTAQQAKDLLTHLQILVELGERAAHGGTTH